MRPGDHVVEFGAGSGHLGLLLANSRPDCTVTLVEIKGWTCNFARDRVAALGVTNCKIFCGSVDEYAGTGDDFDVAVGLHCCGLLTDSVLELAAARCLSPYIVHLHACLRVHMFGGMPVIYHFVSHPRSLPTNHSRAAVCLVPCCYGQIVSALDHQRGGTTAPNMHPRSSAFRQALESVQGGDGLTAFRTVAKAADFNVVKDGGCFDVSSAAFATGVLGFRV